MRCKKCGQLLRAFVCACSVAVSAAAPHGDQPHDHREQHGPAQKSRVLITAVSTATATMRIAPVGFSVKLRDDT